MGKQNVTLEMEQEFIKLYNDGLSSNEIAKKYNIGGSTICRYLKKNNVELRGVSIPENIKQDVISLYRLGFSEENVALQCHISRPIVRKILREKNEHIRTLSEAHRIYYLKEDYFNELNHQNKYWILGFFYADGNVSKSDNNIQIALQARDIDALQKMQKEFESDRPLYFDNRSSRNEKHQDVYCLSIDSEEMRNDLIKWGVMPQKTHYIKYPSFIPNDMHNHFLRGVMDGDGCIHQGFVGNHRCRSVDICGTYDFCIGTKKIIESILNIHCSVILTNKKSNTYKVTVSGIYNSIKFLDWIYKDAELYLDRKYNLFQELYKTAT